MTVPKLLFKGRRFHVERVVQTMPDGAEHTRDVVRHPDAVTILPLLEGNRVCLIENYRVAVEEKLVELPAGVIEPGEDPADTARRELAEETGYQTDRVELLTTFYTSPGVLDERMYLYLATELQPGQAAPEPGEDLRPMVVAWEEAIRMIRDGRIHDGKTLAGLLYYETVRRQEES